MKNSPKPARRKMKMFVFQTDCHPIAQHKVQIKHVSVVCGLETSKLLGPRWHVREPSRSLVPTTPFRITSEGRNVLTWILGGTERSVTRIRADVCVLWEHLLFELVIHLKYYFGWINVFHENIKSRGNIIKGQVGASVSSEGVTYLPWSVLKYPFEVDNYAPWFEVVFSYYKKYYWCFVPPNL